VEARRGKGDGECCAFRESVRRDRVEGERGKEKRYLGRSFRDREGGKVVWRPAIENLV